MKTEEKNEILLTLLKFIVFILIVLLVINFIGSFERNVDNRQLQLIENTITRYAVSCYALEGFYPDDIHYLVDNYGLTLDEENYLYHYENLGSNLLPQIKVFSLIDKK